MGEIINVIQAIMKAIDKPWQAIAASISALFLYILVLVQKGKFRDEKAETEKNEQKAEDNSTLENTNAEADSSVRDRLQRRK